ncbi:MAG: phosphoribosylaminoimidazolesuccinocarboxamide synthase, partial [Deltaproteobacteria bacterium]
ELQRLGEPVRGKVRDVYDLGDRLLIVTTDRISAFDVVLGTVPLKGQVLNTIAAWQFEQTADIVPNHVLARPDPAAMLVRKLRPLPVELVVRRFITGSLWRAYENGERNLYGLSLPDGLRKDQRFEEPIITPTTKADQGEHDKPLSPSEVVERGLVPERAWNRLCELSIELFKRGEQLARERDLLLVDTKYEFALDPRTGEPVLIDEVHTPDSSRYWEASEYEARFERGEPQLMLDKENMRQWLLERGFSGDGRPPPLTDEVRVSLGLTYARLQQRLCGEPPEIDPRPAAERLEQNLRKAGII